MRYCPQCQTALQIQLLGEQERLACPNTACGFVHWDNPIPVVAAIVQNGEQFILGRNAQWPAGWFSMLTGFLEKQEHPDQAIQREVYEEVGLTAEQVQFIDHYTLPQRNQLILAYWVKTRGTVTLSEEIIEVRALSRAELLHYNFGQFRLVEQIVRDVLDHPATH